MVKLTYNIYHRGKELIVVADFCLDCWNRINKTNDSEKKYVMSDEPSLCEGCGEMKRVIEGYKSAYYLYRFRYVICFFAAFFKVLFLPIVIAVRAVRRSVQTSKK